MSQAEELAVKPQKVRPKRRPQKIVVCETEEEPKSDLPPLQIGAKFVPKSKRLDLTAAAYKPNVFKQELTELLAWTGMDTYEILSEDKTFTPAHVARTVVNKNHIAIIIEDEENNRYGGYINEYTDETNVGVSDPDAFVFTLQVKGRKQCEKYPLRRGFDEDGILFQDFAFILPDFTTTGVLFQYGEGDVMVATYDGKLCARRIPTSYEYSAEMAAEIQKNDTIPVKRMYIVQFKGKRSEEYKVFVMDVPSELPDDVIRESLEARLGKDDILDIRINKDKREMCAVYISMKDLETAKKAIKSLNMHRVEGHPVRATWYYEHGPSALYKRNNLYIDMPDYKKKNITEEKFLKFFKQFGEIRSSLFRGKYGFILYEDPEVVKRVKELNGTTTAELGYIEISRKR